MQLPQLKRIRWAVRAALFLGVAASVAANVLHAEHNPISQTISAWPPLALLLTVELVSRVPMHRWSLAALRILSTVAIAGIAAWVSYWHMQSVALHYGEATASSYLLPVSVDGLIVVASVSLVELAGRIRTLEDARIAAAAATAAAPATPTAPAVAPVQFVAPAPVAPAPAAPTTPVFQPAPAPQPSAALTESTREQAQARPRGESLLSAAARADLDRVFADRQALTEEAIADAPVSPAVVPAARPLGTARPTTPYTNGSRPNVARPAVSTVSRTIVTSPTTKTTKPAESTTPRQRRPVQETAELAAAIKAEHPEISESELAQQLGISETRLRAVRREAREVRRLSSAR